MTEGIRNGRHEPHRIALLQLRLERIIVRIGAPFKGVYVTEEACSTRTSKITVGRRYAAQTVCVGSQVPFGQEMATAVCCVSDIEEVVIRQLILDAQVRFVDGLVLEVRRNRVKRRARCENRGICYRRHGWPGLEVVHLAGTWAKDLVHVRRVEDKRITPTKPLDCIKHPYASPERELAPPTEGIGETHPGADVIVARAREVVPSPLGSG